MELHEALQNVKFDKRLVDWHLKQGSLTNEELAKHLKSLPDSTNQAIPLVFEDEPLTNGQGPHHQ